MATIDRVFKVNDRVERTNAPASFVKGKDEGYHLDDRIGYIAKVLKNEKSPTQYLVHFMENLLIPSSYAVCSGSGLKLLTENRFRNDCSGTTSETITITAADLNKSCAFIDIYPKTPSDTAKVPKVRKIIYNDPATIIFWEDDTKTVVKCAKGEKYNKYNAFCAAYVKKVFGNNSRVRKIVDGGEDQIAVIASKTIKTKGSKSTCRKK